MLLFDTFGSTVKVDSLVNQNTQSSLAMSETKPISVTREYQVPKNPTFTAGSTIPLKKISASLDFSGGTPPNSCRDLTDVAAEGDDHGWCVVQEADDANTYVMHNVVDNIMFSTNGYLGVKHRSETQTGILRSYVKVNGLFHCVPVTPELRSAALPTSDEVGAVACVMDLNVFINGEPCTLLEMQHRCLDMRDASYRCICRIADITGEVTFTLSYKRFASLVTLSEWAAEVVFSDFTLAEDIFTHGGRSFLMTAVAEMSVARDGWECDMYSTFERVVARSLTTSNGLVTLTSTRCTKVASDGTPSTIAGTMEKDPDRSLRGGLHPQFQGNEQGYSAFSSSDCEGVAAHDISGMDHNYAAASGREGRSVFCHRFEIPFDGEDLPTSVTVSLLCRHEKFCQCSEQCRTPSFNSPMNAASNGPATTHACASPLASVLARSIDAVTPALIETRRLAQKVVLDAFWETFEAQVEYQDEVHKGRLGLAFHYSAFVAFCTGLGAHHGIARNALSSPGISMQYNLQHYLYHGIFYVFVDPSAAKRMLYHLVSMLPRARAHARHMSLSRGALYPHSTLSGRECGCYFLNRSPRYHINADISYVVFLYLEAVAVTNNAELLTFVELLLETARVWLEVGEWQEHHTVFRIDQVAGPDEYSGLVEDNFYTNLSVKNQLSQTVLLVEKLRKNQAVASSLTELLDRLGIHPEELDEMRDAAQSIVLNRDNRLGVYFSHQNFDSLRQWTSGELNFPLYLNYHPLVVYRHKLCEVPEVLLGMLLYPKEFERLDITRNLAYYEPLCTHDTPESLSVVAATQFRAYGDFGKGMALLEAVAQIDLDNITYTAEEGVHLSAMTSSWIALAFGIGGLRVIDGSLHFSPSLPVGVERVAFTVQWRGSVVKVTISGEHIEYRLVRGETFRLIHFEMTRIHLHEGYGDFLPQTTMTIPRAVVQQVTAHFDGVVFSIESLVENLLDINYEAWERVLTPFFEWYANQNGTPPAIPMSMEEYIQRMVYQEEDRHANYSGLNHVLVSRGINLELGSVTDMEIVATRFGLANAKIEEVKELLRERQLVLLDGAFELLADLKKMGIRLALVSYTRSMYDALKKLPPDLANLFTTMIDGAEAREKHMRGRPHIDLFDKAARKMHISTGRCVVVATHLDQGYKAHDLQQFLALLDIEEERSQQVRMRSSSKHCDPLNDGLTSSFECPVETETPVLSRRQSFNQAGSPRTPGGQQGDGHYSSSNVLSIGKGKFPKSTAELEDLIVGTAKKKA